MKKLKKAPKKLKSVNEIPKFSDKHGFDLFKIKNAGNTILKKQKEMFLPHLTIHLITLTNAILANSILQKWMKRKK